MAVKGVVFDRKSTETADDPKILICNSPNAEYFCSPNPCRNGGTCMGSPGHTPAYTCQCDLGYDDTDCDVSVQLLIVNPDKTGLWVANISDFVFSSFIELGDSARIGNVYFDDGVDALYWGNLATPDWSIFLRQMTFDILMVKLGMPNRTLLSNKHEALYPCLTMDVKKQELYWAEYLTGYRRRTVGEEEALYGIVSDLGKIPGSVNPSRCVIDQQRRYFYAIGFIMGSNNLAITRFHLDSWHSEIISSDVGSPSMYGLTIDEKGE
ncbi:uncharacterized protein LOC115921825 [Strongylocentrotus purpuratus]|uniref:EGF-like domain-containing protein n=1 Tax=Strongylocentrotus purpuratus TaxID=7668 RepID=A0A7M7SW72_STRPU|nr:uncharacterized protein LOC115921825 [Strongylocentrotus purpuratus]